MSDEERLREIFLEHLDMDEADYDPEATPDSLSLDSLEMLEIVMEIEEEFGIHLNEEDLSQEDTLGQIVEKILDIIEKRR